MRWIISSLSRNIIRFGKFPPTFPTFTPALAYSGVAQETQSSLAEKVEEVLKSRIDYHSSNEKGRTQRMAAFAAKNRELAKIKEKELQAKRDAEQGEILILKNKFNKNIFVMTFLIYHIKCKFLYLKIYEALKEKNKKPLKKASAKQLREFKKKFK